MNNVANRVSFLRTSREFPENLHQLSVEVNRSYVDIASAVNSRIISIFPTNRAAINGEAWFLSNQRQQGLRQVYSFTSTADINHMINVLEISQFSRCWGTYTNGTNTFGLIFGTDVVVPGIIQFFITPNSTSSILDGKIKFVVGAGAPALTSGTIVLEWLVNKKFELM